MMCVCCQADVATAGRVALSSGLCDRCSAGIAAVGWIERHGRIPGLVVARGLPGNAP